MAAVLSFLMPGLGQIYNKEIGKGWGIVALTLLVMVGTALWITPQIVARVPTVGGVPSADRAVVQTIAAEVANEKRHVLFFVTYASIGIWAFSITQAYFKAKEIADKEAGQ